MYRRVAADFEKPNKIFLINNEQGIMERREKWFPEFFLNILTLNFFFVIE